MEKKMRKERIRGEKMKNFSNFMEKGKKLVFPIFSEFSREILRICFENGTKITKITKNRLKQSTKHQISRKKTKSGKQWTWRNEQRRSLLLFDFRASLSADQPRGTDLRSRINWKMGNWRKMREMEKNEQKTLKNSKKSWKKSRGRVSDK